MSSDLPPGVTESMIPGNRPEDEAVEVTITLTRGDIDGILNGYVFNKEMIWDDIVEQVEYLFNKEMIWDEIEEEGDCHVELGEVDDDEEDDEED